MSISTAKLRLYRQAPRKVRAVARVVRGLSIEQAQSQLRSMSNRAAQPLAKVLNAAIANAHHTSDDTTLDHRLYIKEVRVDGGPTLKRFRPRAHGRAAMIRKRTSHISIVLGAHKRSGQNANKNNVKKIVHTKQ